MKQTIFKTYSVQRVKESSKKYSIESATIRSPQDASDIFKTVFQTESMTKEHLLLASLDTKNKVTALHVVHMGSINASIVHPREVFQLAILDNAASIMIAHNHPSGDSSPSQEDVQVTKRIKEAGKIIGIELLDHIVLGDHFTSLKEKGYC